MLGKLNVITENKSRMITDKAAKALQIIRDHNITMPSQFGRLLWPDDPGWKRLGKAGPNGVAHGTGMRLASGAYLGKLERRGLIRRRYSIDENRPYALTDAGTTALNEWEKGNKIE